MSFEITVKLIFSLGEILSLIAEGTMENCENCLSGQPLFRSKFKVVAFRIQDWKVTSWGNLQQVPPVGQYLALCEWEEGSRTETL
jgi:hypothetical protein